MWYLKKLSCLKLTMVTWSAARSWLVDIVWISHNITVVIHLDRSHLMTLNPCMLGNFAFFFLSSADFFQNKLFRIRILRVPSEWQTVWIQMRPDILSGLICVQIVCKGYEQMTSHSYRGLELGKLPCGYFLTDRNVNMSMTWGGSSCFLLCKSFSLIENKFCLL